MLAKPRRVSPEMIYEEALQAVLDRTACFSFKDGRRKTAVFPSLRASARARPGGLSSESRSPGWSMHRARHCVEGPAHHLQTCYTRRDIAPEGIPLSLENRRNRPSLSGPAREARTGHAFGRNEMHQRASVLRVAAPDSLGHRRNRRNQIFAGIRKASLMERIFPTVRP
jgi:hypothetical protein